MSIHKLSEAQCATAMKDGEFGSDIVRAAGSVVVVLTQGWCPQWMMMRRWLESASTEVASTEVASTEVRVFYIEYDKEEFFEPFMAWKEDYLGNRSVPYLRYYRDGILTGESNYVSKDAFKAAHRRLPASTVGL